MLRDERSANRIHYIECGTVLVSANGSGQFGERISRAPLSKVSKCTYR